MLIEHRDQIGKMGPKIYIAGQRRLGLTDGYISPLREVKLGKRDIGDRFIEEGRTQWNLIRKGGKVNKGVDQGGGHHVCSGMGILCTIIGVEKNRGLLI